MRLDGHPVCTRLKAEGREERVREKTGRVLDPYFSATKIAWRLDHFRRARKRAESGAAAFGAIDSWLLWKPTAGPSVPRT